jgi:pimeloyl-ACP methyl ester carboxylesterase
MTQHPITKECPSHKLHLAPAGSRLVIGLWSFPGHWSLAIGHFLVGIATFSALIAASGNVMGGAVYMKDGFTLHGNVRREATLLIDPLTGQAIPVFKGSNFFILDDRVRWVIFHHSHVESADPDVNVRSDFIELADPLPGGQKNKLPGSARLEKITPFDDRWQRTVFLANELGKYTIKQRLTLLSPYAARIESNSYQWNIFYLTKELGLDAVKKLLDSHPDTKEENGPDVDRRLKRFRFILQAGWLVAAQEELDRAVKDLPKDKAATDRLDRSRTALKQAQVRDLWEEIQTAHRAGRYRYVKAILGRLPLNELDDRTASEVASLKAKYDGWDRHAKDLDRLLDVVNGRLVGPLQPQIDEAEAMIRAGAGPDMFERLEPFLTIAAQYEKEAKAGKKPSYAPDDIFALAATGWLMGREAAEPQVAAMERYWAGHEFVRSYLRTQDPAGRKRLLDDYQTRSPLSLDEVAQMITLAAPPETAEPGTTVAPGVEERQTKAPSGTTGPVTYDLQLPLEYHSSRQYPLLIALHGAGERPLEALGRWSAEAARQGYILAAPDWGGTTGYNYSPDEHAIVTEMIRDLRRRFAVDSDRVFLTGYGDGATMAFDVGLSHPDLFAGIIPVNGRPRRSTTYHYWHNAQYLPFYIVAGELAGDCVSLNRWPFENWMNRGYGSLMVVYKGRPMEQFVGETPTIFDWMNRKKRATGFPELGRNANSPSAGEEFQSMREGDNHFYWVSIEQILDKYVNHDIGMKVGSPAGLEARIRDGNSVYVNARGIKNLRLWFGRIWDAQSGWRPMIDFTKPVKITVNGRMFGRERTVQPSLQTMLDDLYLRGDRQRMFLAYVDLPNLQ